MISAYLCTRVNIVLVYIDDKIVLSDDDVHTDEVVTAFKTRYAMQDWVASSNIWSLLLSEVKVRAYAKGVVARCISCYLRGRGGLGRDTSTNWLEVDQGV